MTIIQGLMSSTNYSIEVAAVNSVDTGPYSDPITVEIPQSKWEWNIFVVNHYTVLIDVYSSKSYFFRCISQSD